MVDPGPSAEDIEAAGEMNAEDRKQMILLMVTKHHREIQMETDKENSNMHRQVDF